MESVGPGKRVYNVQCDRKCFSVYAAIVVSRYPEKTRDLWAYQALMIDEERRCGGKAGGSMTQVSGSR